jgi:PIN domain nuclease of toxin-antitoxin system
VRRVLLDTKVWLWMLSAPDRLSESSLKLLRTPETELVLSAASAWEIAIKYALGKLSLPEAPDAYITRLIAQTGVIALPIYHRHALRVATLPPHHADPFDRLLVAQAQLERLPVLTADRVFALYDVETIKA